MMVVLFLFVPLHQKNVLENFRAFWGFPSMLGVQILELNGHKISVLFRFSIRRPQVVYGVVCFFIGY